MTRDDFGQPVVGERRERAARVRIERLYARRGQRQHVHRDAIRVHDRKALLLEIEQPPPQRIPGNLELRKVEVGIVLRGLEQTPKQIHLLGERERFFDRDAAPVASGGRAARRGRRKPERGCAEKRSSIDGRVH